ncbi:hypothetical protein EV356DRAFT_574077 [Viridothelium virens]|uniref:Uncharacterized protein n=1 Tax=Viridothelium virens TaxID=1048519 RepID=A0A6A6HHU7_VIRVR|nr:hypothetical protein EV356DRAFT_574077 [Viridothelium virens]
MDPPSAGSEESSAVNGGDRTHVECQQSIGASTDYGEPGAVREPLTTGMLADSSRHGFDADHATPRSTDAENGSSKDVNQISSDPDMPDGHGENSGEPHQMIPPTESVDFRQRAHAPIDQSVSNADSAHRTTEKNTTNQDYQGNGRPGLRNQVIFSWQNDSPATLPPPELPRTIGMQRDNCLNSRGSDRSSRRSWPVHLSMGSNSPNTRDRERLRVVERVDRCIRQSSQESEGERPAYDSDVDIE